MTITAPPLTGQDINVAARATRLVLVAELDTVDLTFEDWIVINLISTGQVDDEPALRQRLAAGLGLEETDVDRVLGGLVAAELVEHDGDRLGLTTDGERRWNEGQAVVAELISVLYAGLDPADLATTRRVLVEVTTRAQARLDG